MTFEPIGRFYKIQYGGHAIEGDLDALIFNAVAAAILNFRHSNF
jgi:hypothetical protein